ncbi:MAG: phosphate/phosphite/phosphonate ABC transporter substrate-binding protein [Betaproteobacteria bacterium]|nr:phosphate/phosphite/phosphonate ABC transporter substrate-binding protein [Betaproteobacteria bacterium]
MHRLLVLLGVFLSFCSGHLWAESYKPSGTAATETVYTFAPHPYLTPKDLFAAYDPIMRYLEKKIPGVKFQVETSKDYAAYEAKIADRGFHFGLPNPYQTVLGLKHGYRVIAKMTPDEDFRGWMIVRKDRKPRQPRDLAGQIICFPSASAVAATMLPMLYLHDHGLNLKETSVKYVGSPASAIMSVHSGDAAACGVSVRHWRIWSKDNPDKAGTLEPIWQTASLPHNGVIARSDVPPKLAQQVAAVLIGMDKDPNLDQSQFTADQAHFETAPEGLYKIMEQFLKRYDEAIGLPAQMKPQPAR